MTNKSRREFLQQSVGLIPALGAIACSSQSPNSNNSNTSPHSFKLRPVAEGVKYDEVFQIEIDDPDVSAKVKGFLEFFQRSEFTMTTRNPQSGAETTTVISGPKVLADIKATVADRQKQLAAILDDPTMGAEEKRALTGLSESFRKNGKVSIADMEPQPTIPNSTAITLGIGEDATKTVPIGIVLFPYNMKRARFVSTDGKQFVPSIDGIITNELYHVLTGNTSATPENENKSNDFENVVVGAMKGQLRTNMRQTRVQTPVEIPTLYDKARYTETSRPQQPRSGFQRT